MTTQTSRCTYESIPYPQSINMERVFANKISGLNPWQIELIGVALVREILPYLGDAGKMHVQEKVLRARGALANLSTLRLVLLTVGDWAASGKGVPPFLSMEKAALFVHSMLLSVRDNLRHAFSHPMTFMEDGFTIPLSDIVPLKILEESTRNVGRNINADEVPSYYSVTLSLDKALSAENSALVFSVAQFSNGVEFTKRTFTVGDLEREFRSSTARL